MVRISDVFGPGGFKGPEERKPPPPASSPRQEPTDIVSLHKELQRETEERRLQAEADTLYTEGLTLIQNFFDKTRREETPSVDTARDFVRRVALFMAGGGDSLLVLATGVTSGYFLYTHSLNVSIISVKVGLGLRYDKTQLIELGLTAFLHDIGMAKVPEEILNKSEALTPEEFDQVKQHPFYAVNLLEKSKDLEPIVLLAISQAHERIDGSGYPTGSSGEAINPYAKAIGLIDIYEALTHPRPYRKHYTHEEAMKMIAHASGGGLKLDVLEVLKALVKEISLYPVGSYVQFNTKEIGRVLKVNRNFPLLPVVEILIGLRANKLDEPRRVDLSQEPLLHIQRAVDIMEATALLRGTIDATG